MGQARPTFSKQYQCWRLDADFGGPGRSIKHAWAVAAAGRFMPNLKDRMVVTILQLVWRKAKSAAAFAWTAVNPSHVTRWPL